MAVLKPGARAPEFTLATTDGKQVSLAEALRKGPVVLAFFKVSCPVCQYGFPFYQRVYEAHRDSQATFIGVSQDNLRDTLAFMKQFGVTFPVALDDPSKYAISNAYGLTNVPTILYVAPDGEIEISSVGWSKPDVEAINTKLAERRQQKPSLLWRKGEEVRDFRGG